MSGNHEIKAIRAKRPVGGKNPHSATFITLDQVAFDALFPLLQNHFDANASWTYGDHPGCMFETYGAEHAFVRQQDPRTIWTIQEDGADKTFLQSGYHLVNRIGYLISTNPLPTGLTVHVRLSG